MLGAVVDKGDHARRRGRRRAPRVDRAAADRCRARRRPTWRTAKKTEAERPQLRGQTDHVLTTSELASLLRLRGDVPGDVRPRSSQAQLPKSEYGLAPLGESTSAATTFGARRRRAPRTSSCPACARCQRLATSTYFRPARARGLAGVKVDADVAFPVCGRRRRERPPGRAAPLRGARHRAHARARCLVERVLAGEVRYDFVELMACQLGVCIGGGGQSPSRRADVLQRRAEVVYSLDDRAVRRVSHHNVVPAVLRQTRA